MSTTAPDHVPTPRLAPALVLATVAALASATGHVLGVVRSADGSAVGAGEQAATIAAVAIVVAVAALAAVAVVRRRIEFAGALLAAYGSIALGAVGLDIALTTDPIDANRFELFRPVSAAVLDPTVGAYVLLAGHAASVLAGLAGALAVHRAGLGDGYGHSIYSEHVGRASAVRLGAPLSASIGAFGLLAAVAAFAPLYRSQDPVVLVPAVVDAPLAIALGSAAIGVAALVASATALASPSPRVASGASIGLGLGVLGVCAVAAIAATLTGDRVAPGVGAVLGSVAGLGLLVCGALAVPVANRRDRQAAAMSDRNLARTAVSADRTDASAGSWHIAAGVIGIVSGAFLVLGSFLPALEVDGGLDLAAPDIAATRVSLVAGFALVLPAIVLLFSELAATVRPFVSVFWLAAVFAGASVLQPVVLAGDLDGVGPGLGAWFVVAGVVGAALTGLLALFAGSAERDDVDTSSGAAPSTPVLLVAAIGAALVVAGFLLPLYRSDRAAPAVADLPWGWDTWALVASALGSVAAAVLAAHSRPMRGCALLAGTAAGAAVYFASWPLTSGTATDPAMGLGAVPSASGIVVLAVAAAVSARRKSM